MKKLLSLIALLVLVTAALPGRVHASTQDFVINNFDADYTLSNTDKQGKLKVVEDIDLTFNDNNHGILRAIPKSYKGKSLGLHVDGITSRTGAPTSYTTYDENGNTVLKIGSASSTVTGNQTYKISYTLENVIGFYKDHDEFYWDINGDQWQQPFTHVSVTLHLPAGLELSNNNPTCYAGAYGATGQKCTILTGIGGTISDSLCQGMDINRGGNTVSTCGDSGTIYKSETTAGLLPGETLTVVVGFKKGFFAPPTFLDVLRDIIVSLAIVLVLPLWMFIYAFRRWRKFGRDPKGVGTIIPEYEAPDNLRPVEVGALLNFRADNAGISATIVDLAVRGYIKIIESKEDRLIGKDKLEYSLELTGKDQAGLLPFENDVLSGLRKGLKVEVEADADTAKPSGIVELKSLKNKFYTTSQAVQKAVMERLATNGYFASNPLSAGGRLFVIGGLLTFGSFFFFGIFWPVAIGMLLAGIIGLAFGFAMPARTAKGVAAKDKINGLKLYLNTAEKDRIKMLQSPDAQYAANHDAPKKTVELFEKLLPYAMILKVETEWAKQFKDIYTTPPDWYSGNWSAFNTGLFIGSLNSSMASVNAVAFSSPSSSGSSGFGGGGFSGGGGGGGGGGGW